MCKRAQIHWITANGSHFNKPFCHLRTTAQRSKKRESIFYWPKKTEPRLDHEAVFCSLNWWFRRRILSIFYFLFSYLFFLVGDNFFSCYLVVVIFSIEKIHFFRIKQRWRSSVKSTQLLRMMETRETQGRMTETSTVSCVRNGM